MQLPVLEHYRRLPCPEFIKIENVPALDEKTIVLGVIVVIIQTDVCLKSLLQKIEMVMSHLKIP